MKLNVRAQLFKLFYFIWILTPLIVAVGCAATASNNDSFLMETTGQYQAQDTDTEQNGQQAFQGQLDYLQEHQQDKQAQQIQSQQIQDTMSQEYQQQIQQQSASQNK